MKLFTDFEDVTVREENPVDQSALEKILEVEKEIFVEEKKNNWYSSFPSSKAYSFLYTSVEKKLANITMTAKLLQEYINTRENHNKNKEADILGMYSSTLLQVTCKTQPDKGIQIDGEGRTFNYLFCQVLRASNVTVCNFKGNSILEYAGSFGGSVKNIVAINITGESTLAYLAHNNGTAENIIAANIQGNDVFSLAGSYEGNLKNILATHIKGNRTYEGMSQQFGNAKYIFATCLEGNWNLPFNDPNQGNEDYIVATDLKGNFTFNGTESKVNHFLEDENIDSRQKIIIEKIEQLAKTMYLLPLEEQTKAHEEIARLQTELFAEEK